MPLPVEFRVPGRFHGLPGSQGESCAPRSRERRLQRLLFRSLDSGSARWELRCVGMDRRSRPTSGARSDLLERRRKLMERWGSYIG